jgi:hypothetical protein
VKRVGPLDDGEQLRVGGAGRKLVEEALATAEQDRHLVDEELVEEAGGDRLLEGRGTAADRDVAVVGRLLGFGDRALDPVGDEVEAGPAFELEGVAWVVGEDVDRAVKGRSSPHQPCHSSSGQSPRTGPNMLRPITTAPVSCCAAPITALLGFSSPSPPSPPCMRWKAASLNTHSWSPCPPSPSGWSSLWFGPAM